MWLQIDTTTNDITRDECVLLCVGSFPMFTRINTSRDRFWTRGDRFNLRWACELLIHSRFISPDSRWSIYLIFSESKSIQEDMTCIDDQYKRMSGMCVQVLQPGNLDIINTSIFSVGEKETPPNLPGVTPKTFNNTTSTSWHLDKYNHPKK